MPRCEHSVRGRRHDDDDDDDEDGDDDFEVPAGIRFYDHLPRCFLEKFSECQKAGRGQCDFADQQGLAGQQCDKTERHRCENGDGQHADQHRH